MSAKTRAQDITALLAILLGVVGVLLQAVTLMVQVMRG